MARPFTIDGWQQVLDGLEQGNGVILALPHLGGWEWAGRWMTDQGFKMTVVVEALDPPELFEWFADLRQELGMTVVPTGPKAGPAVLKALRANETVCLLCDRDLDRTGVEVEFFGERTTLAGRPGHAVDPHRRTAAARRLLLHRQLQRSPRPGAARRCRRIDAAACATTSAE